jgi:hypothetical protein
MPICVQMAISELFEGSSKGYEVKKGLQYHHSTHMLREQVRQGTVCAGRTDARLHGACLTPDGIDAPRLSHGLTRANEFCLHCLTSSFPAQGAIAAGAPQPPPPPPAPAPPAPPAQAESQPPAQSQSSKKRRIH